MTTAGGAAPTGPRSCFRTLRISGDGLVRLLTAISAGELKVVHDAIPNGAAIAGMRVDDNGELEVELVHHHWPEGTTAKELELLFIRRLNHRGDTSDWGQPLALH